MKHELAIAKPVALILPTDEDMAVFKALTDPQRAYVMHWMRSNSKRVGDVEMTWLAKRARAQRP